ncbi:hypothetical protein [Desemzia incerta]|nr:hypothetical protein [Desemzia incerta]
MSYKIQFTMADTSAISSHEAKKKLLMAEKVISFELTRIEKDNYLRAHLY